MAKIIIVDDSETVRKQLRSALEEAGHAVIEGVDGLDGFDKIVTPAPPDLVISDYNMPGVDGITMLTRVKEKLGMPKFPIFMLTTETSENIKSAGKLLGVIAWINKPCDTKKLVAAVVKVLSKKV